MNFTSIITIIVWSLFSTFAASPHNKSLDNAIRIAQKLIDRIIFVAFCEDRKLLPENAIRDAWEKVAPFDRVTNPKWQNFLALFDSIDKGNVNEPHPSIIMEVCFSN